MTEAQLIAFLCYLTGCDRNAAITALRCYKLHGPVARSWKRDHIRHLLGIISTRNSLLGGVCITKEN